MAPNIGRDDHDGSSAWIGLISVVIVAPVLGGLVSLIAVRVLVH